MSDGISRNKNVNAGLSGHSCRNHRKRHTSTNRFRRLCYVSDDETKKRDCTGYSRFINRIQQRFKIKLRHGTPRFHHTFNMRSLIAVGLMSLLPTYPDKLFLPYSFILSFLYPYGIHDSNQCYTNIGENSFPKCSQSTGSQNQYQQFHTKRQ